MVNKIKNNSTQGLYITEDEGGAVAGNTPGEIDLDNLTGGAASIKYIYFDVVLRFEEKSTYNREGDDWIGLKTWATAQGSVQASTGGAAKTFFMITVETDETTAEYVKQMGILNVKTGATAGVGKIKYLVKQTASEAFEQFPNPAGTLRKMTAIIIRGTDIVELGIPGKDVKLITLALERITAR